jgi:tetratricopeptide (TPR) repeat protein
MREGSRSPILLLLGIGCAAFAAVAQTPAPPLSVTVIVTNAIAQPPQPVKAAHVSLTHLISAQLAVDAQGPTNPRGEAQLLLSQSAAKNGDLRIVISGAGNLVIYEPADGQLPSLKSPIRIVLLPTGSLALLGPAQIEAMLHRTLLQMNTLERQVTELKQSAAEQKQKPDLGPSIAEWAQANGFSDDQVTRQVEQWAQGIQRQSAQATTAEQKALAELALKHYADAAQLFNQAGDADRQQIDSVETQEKALQAAQQALLDKLRTPLRQLLDHSQQAAGADQLNLQYHQATLTLEDAAATAQAEYKRHPDDKGFQELWLQAVSNAANARWQEGKVSPANESLALLAQSADDFRSLAREYAALGERQEVGSAQLGLGTALDEEGRRVSGNAASVLLAQAAEAFESALQVYTKDVMPQDWAKTQMRLGNVLKDEGQSASGDKASALLTQAVEAYQSALQVYTKADLPQEWAKTEMNLGSALLDEGERAGGDKAMDLFGQAVQAYKNALEIYSKTNLPLNWAWTELNLGVALLDEGERAAGDKAAALLDQAVQAFQHALEVETKTDLPQDWAMTQNNLGIALTDEGERAGGDTAVVLFDQAGEAFQNALQIYTKTDLPRDWARTENNFGAAWKAEGERVGGEKAPALFAQAVQAYRNALEVYTKADLPQDWARTLSNLGSALEDEGDRTSGDQAAALLDQAVQAYRSALEVRTKAGLPQDWAATQNNLGNALMDEGERASGDKAAALLAQAVEAFQNALQVYTRADLPQGWAAIELNIMEADFVSSRFEDCFKTTEILTNDMLWGSLDYSRDAMRFACAVAAGEHAAARDALKVLSAKAPAVKTSAYDYSGILRFLSSSPAFANGRASWIALFTAVQNGDSAGMTAALHQLEPIF